MNPTPTPSDRNAPGSLGTVGRYTLLAKLATGGMAEIFLSKQSGPQGFEKLVVIKRILPSYAEDPGFVQMFLDEARVAAQLSHPNIAQIFDLGEDQGSYYIAMEYLGGESLAQVAHAARQRQLPVPLPFAARFVSSAAQALDYAHRKKDAAGRPLGIVHRDVSPQNLMVTYEGDLKVLDFGIAKAANRATLTVGNQIKGKPAYMAPEQAAGKALDGRADVFALGVVLFEAVTASRLFAREDMVQTLAAVIGSEPIPLASSRNPEVTPELDAIVARALERDLAKRYPSAAALHEDLEGYLRQVGSPASSEIAEYMRSLFEERMAKRQAIVEAASRGDEISSSGLSRPGTDTAPSMPGRTDVGPTPAAKGGRGPLLAVAGLVGLGLIGVAAAMLRPKPAPVVIQVPAPPPAPSPAPAPTSVHIDSDPPHAVVVVDGVDHGQAPVTLAALALGAHQVSLHLPGHEDVKRELKLEQPGQNLDLVVSLPAAAPAPAPAPTPPPKAAEEAPKAPRVKKEGRLSLETVPWTRVYLGSKDLGETPLLKVPLPVGTHHLHLVNPSAKIDQSIEVTIEADQVTVTRLRL